MRIGRTNTRKDERGIAHVLLALIVVGVVGVGGFAFWRISSYNNNKDTGSAANNTATLSDECVAATGDENICRLGAISDLSKYAAEVRMTTQGGDGMAVTYVVKYDGNGNSAVESDAIRGITIGSQNFVYIADRWYDTGGDPSQTPQDPVDFGIATTAGIKYENLGKEKCGDDTCFRYRMSGGILGDGVVICLFGDKDYLPRYYETTGGLTGSITMTIDYKPVTVTAPEGALPIGSLYSDFDAGAAE